MNDLLSLVVTVQAEEDTLLGESSGRAIHALLLRWIAARDSALARQLHDESALKPFTVSTLVGTKHMGTERGLPAGATAWFRLTTLRADIAESLAVYQAFPPKTLEIDGKSLRVVQVTSDPQQHPWAASTSYQTLAAPYLLAEATPPRRVRLQFVSATVFRSDKHDNPFPQPDLVFGSLADRWNAFSNITLSQELREYARLALNAQRFELSSRGVLLKERASVVGSVGYVEYKALHYDRYWQSLIGLLATYARFAGVGRHTAQGLGQVQQVDVPVRARRVVEE